MNNMKYSDTNTVNKFLYEIQSFFFFYVHILLAQQTLMPKENKHLNM